MIGVGLELAGCVAARAVDHAREEAVAHPLQIRHRQAVRKALQEHLDVGSRVGIHRVRLCGVGVVVGIPMGRSREPAGEKGRRQGQRHARSYGMV